jgi:hypothetical protein
MGLPPDSMMQRSCSCQPRMKRTPGYKNIDKSWRGLGHRQCCAAPTLKSRVAMPSRESHRSIGVVLVCLVSTVPIPTLGQGQLSDRVLTVLDREDTVFFASPRPGEERLRFLLTLIARSARVPIGFEEVAGVPLPFDGDLTKIPLSARTDLIGLTVGEALNALVSADPRYRWSEQDGVILIRPVEAWEDPQHFLYQGFAGFRLVDSTASDVARAIYTRFGVPINFGEGGVLGEPRGPDAGLEKRMTFDVPSGSMLDALNSVVRTHGGLGWIVYYARAPVDIKTSCVRFVTFNGKFTGVGAAACQPTAGAERRGAGRHGPSNFRMHQTALGGS